MQRTNLKYGYHTWQGYTVRLFQSHLWLKITVCDPEIIFRCTCATIPIKAKNYNYQMPLHVRYVSTVTFCTAIGCLMPVNQASGAKDNCGAWLKLSCIRMKSIKFYFKSSVSIEAEQSSFEKQEEKEQEAYAVVPCKKQKISVKGKPNFRNEWLDAFPWLQYERDKDVMLCKYCKEAGAELAGPTMFVCGNSHFKRESLVKHGNSQRHLRCRDIFINRSQPNNHCTIQAAAKRQISLTNAETLRQLKIKFNTRTW